MTSELTERVTRAFRAEEKLNWNLELGNDEDVADLARIAIAAVQANAAEQAAELAKFKALAETLAGAGNKVADAAYHGEECPMNTTGAHCNCGYDKAFDEWNNALHQYKEARDV